MSPPNTSDESIKMWLKMGNLEKLEQAVLNGHGDQLRGKTSRIPRINNFLKQVPHFQSKIDAIHQAVAQGKLREVHSLMDRKKLATSRTQTGATPLHTAVLNKQANIIKYILEKFPAAIHAKDNHGRTPLHYAAVVDDEGNTYKTLLEYEADKKAADSRGKTAEYYLQNPEEMPLKSLREGATKVVTRRNERISRPSELSFSSIPSKVEIRTLVQKGDLHKLEAIVLGGYGDRLLGETSVNSRVSEFLNQIPEFMFKVATLHAAAVEGSLRDVRNILDRRILAVAKDPYGSNVLHRAVVHNHHNIVKYLVENYPETINATDADGRTPLHYSVAVEDDRIYKTLIGAGADESIKDNKGNTAIHYKENPDELDLLEMQNRINRLRSKLQASKKSSITRNSRHEGGFHVTTANIRKWIHAEDIDRLQQVVFEGHGKKLLVETSKSQKVKDFLKSVPTLITRIRNVHQAVHAGDIKELEEKANNKQFYLSKDIGGLSPIHKAVLLGNREVTQFIIEQCPDSVKAKDNEGRTALHLAAALPKDDNFIYNLLAEAGADTKQMDHRGNSPEYYQSHPAEAEVKTLLSRLSKNSKKDSLPNNALRRHQQPPQSLSLRATKNSTTGSFTTLSPEHVTKLINQGDIEKLEQLVLEGYGKKLYGKTSWIEDVRTFLKKVPFYMDKIYAVHTATDNGDLRAVEDLMTNKRLVVAKNEKGLTPLHRAVKFGKTDIVKYFVQMYPEAVNIKDNEGRTPLHLAGMYKDRDELYKLLLSVGSDPTILDIQNKTPEDYYQDSTKLETKSPKPLSESVGETSDQQSEEEVEEEKQIMKWIKDGNINNLEKLIIDGKGDLLLGKTSDSDPTQEFLEAVPTTMGKIRAIHNAAWEGELRELQKLLDKKEYASARDSLGACPLHKALLKGHVDIVRYLANNYPATLNIKDNEGRTALHYAAVAKDGGLYYRLLHKHGADPNIKDSNDCTPGHYLRGKGPPLSFDELIKRYEEKKVPPRPPSVQTWQRPPTEEILRALTPSPPPGTDENEASALTTDHVDNETAEIEDTKEQETDKSELSTTDDVKEEGNERTTEESKEKDATISDEVEEENATTTEEKKENDAITTDKVEQEDTTLDKVKEKDATTTENGKEKDATTTENDKEKDATTTENGKEKDTVSTDEVKEKDAVTTDEVKEKDAVTTEEVKEKDATTTEEIKQDATTTKEVKEDTTTTDEIKEKNETATEVKKEGATKSSRPRSKSPEQKASTSTNSKDKPDDKSEDTATEDIAESKSDEKPGQESAEDGDGDKKNEDKAEKNEDDEKNNDSESIKKENDKDEPPPSKENKAPDNEKNDVEDENSTQVKDETNSNQEKSSNNEEKSLNNEEMSKQQETERVVTEDKSRNDSPSTPNGLKSSRNHSRQSNNSANPIMWTKEGEYLASVMGDALIKALTEVSQKRPKDPVGFLSVWLYLYAMQSVEKPASPNLDVEVDDNDPLMNSTGLKKEDMEEGLYEARLARSSGRRSSNSGRSNSSENQKTASLKDEDGRTLLHFAAKRRHEGDAFWQLLLIIKCNPSEKDSKYMTPRDVAEEAQLLDNVRIIDKFVATLIVNNKLDLVQDLIIRGYDHILDVQDPETKQDILTATEKRGQTEMVNLLNTIKSFEEQVTKLHDAIEKTDLETVKQLMTNNDLAIARNFYARCSLHVAVLRGDVNTIEYVASTYPDTIKVKDNMGRTPLHYAMGMENSQEIAKILIQYGASRKSRDVKSNTPSYYFLRPQEITDLPSQLNHQQNKNK